MLLVRNLHWKHFFSAVQGTVCNTFSHPPFCLSSDLASVSFNDPFAIQLFGWCPFKWDYFWASQSLPVYKALFCQQMQVLSISFQSKCNLLCNTTNNNLNPTHRKMQCLSQIFKKNSQACAVKVIWDCKGPFPFCGDFPRRGFVIWMSKLESVSQGCKGKYFLKKGI